MKKLSLFIFLVTGALFFLLENPLSVDAQRQSAQTTVLSPTVSPNAGKIVPQIQDPQTLPMNTEADVPQNLSTYTQSVFIEITSAVSCLLSGVDPIRPTQPCLGFDPETRKIGYVDSNGGALGLMGGLIASTYNIPASSGEYFRYMAGNFGVTQDATAARVSEDHCDNLPEGCVSDAERNFGFGTGNGFESLRPLLEIWTAMRNIVYLLFVLVFIILGLGIMFRIQIDPRAVLSIQSQLPKVVIALILVTFSYAIAGFLIDMMYLSLYLIINIFQGQGLDVSTSLDTNPINAAGGLGSGGISGVAYDAAKGVSGIMSSLFSGTFGSVFKGIINTVFGALIGAGAGSIIPGVGTLIGGVVGAVGGNFLGFIPGLSSPFTMVVGAIAWVIIVIALLSALFRLWFTLIKTYVFILINITFAPIWIAFGLLPGSTLTFGNWIRSLVSNLAAFPLILVLFSLGKTLQDGFRGSGPNSFVPPYVGDPGDMNVFASIIGMGIILLAPEAVNITKSALKAPESKFTSSIGRSLGVGQGVLGKGLGAAKSSLWYTNPHTGEAGRLKAWTGTKVSEKLDKVPVLGKGIDKIKYKYGGDKTREVIDAKRKAEEEIKAEAARKKSGAPEPEKDIF